MHVQSLRVSYHMGHSWQMADEALFVVVQELRRDPCSW